MSPEQAEGKKIDPRSDIFSFGAVLYEIVTGQKAFQGDSKMSTLAAIIHKGPKPLSAKIPRDLEKVISWCLRKDIQRRFQHMDDVKIALEELKIEKGIGCWCAGGDRSPRSRCSRQTLVGGCAGSGSRCSRGARNRRLVLLGPIPTSPGGGSTDCCSPHHLSWKRVLSQFVS
jgi:serine/threonine protein kinase